MNTATAAAVGTSPEVLQHYLTAGIEVQTPDHRGKLVGLNHGRFQSPVELDIEAIDIGGHLGGLCYYPYGLCLPVLRDFSQLTVPLPTGEVPAVEVAKLVMQANRPESRTPIANYAAPVLRETGEVVSVECHRDSSYTLDVLMDTTWAVCTVYDFGIVYAHNMLAVHDYLRSKHFALPINGRPLVANVDFIPLAAPSTPTREADNTATTIL